MTTKRKFGDRNYYLKHTWSSKRDAMKEASDYRKDGGWWARVAKVDQYQWGVYLARK